MIIDVNASYGAWPFQVFPFQDLEGLENHLNERQVDQALVSHLGTVFYPDSDYYNQQLFQEAEGKQSIIPVPVLNLKVPGWDKRLEQYREKQDLKTVKIIPSYHLYELKDDVLAELVKILLELKMPLLLQVRLEDERNQYRGLTIQGVPATDIIDFNHRFPDLKVLCLNNYLPEAVEIAGKTNDNLAFDISFTERSNTVDTLTGAIPAERLFLGTHTPILYTLSALMKVQYSTRGEEVKKAIAAGNAQAWFSL